MIHPETLCYLYLMQTVLGELNKLNKFFQRGDVAISLCADQVEKTFKNLVSCIMRRDKIAQMAAASIILEIKSFDLCCHIDIK